MTSNHNVQAYHSRACREFDTSSFSSCSQNPILHRFIEASFRLLSLNPNIHPKTWWARVQAGWETAPRIRASTSPWSARFHVGPASYKARPRSSGEPWTPQDAQYPTQHMLITLVSFRRLASELSGSELDQVRRVDVRDSGFTTPFGRNPDNGKCEL